MIDHVEELEDHVAPAPRGKATGNVVAFVLIVAALCLGWKYLRPSSAFASGDWLTDWDQAVEKSQSTGKPALVLFTADWCPSCRQFESSTLHDSSVRQFLSENYTLVVIDLTKQDGPNMERARDFGVSSIPTLIVYDKS